MPAKSSPGKGVRWYKPTIGQTLELMGWKCVFFLPAVALLAMLVILPWRPRMVLPILLVGWKPAILAVTLPTAHALKIAKNSIQERKEPFCIHCGYRLEGLQDDYQCPECGEHYTFNEINSYRRDPDLFVERQRMKFDFVASHEPFDALPSKRPRSRDGT